MRRKTIARTVVALALAAASLGAGGPGPERHCPPARLPEALAIPPEDLARFGIDLETLNPLRPDDQGARVFCWDREPDAGVVLETGCAVRLWTVRLKKDLGGVAGASALPIPLASLDAVAFDPAFRALLVGEDGTKFLLADLERGSVRPLARCTPEAGGFRLRGPVGTAGGHFYAVGVFVEPGGMVAETPALVEVRVEGPRRFRKAMDLGPIFRESLRAFHVSSLDRVYYVMAPEKDGPWTLGALTPGGKEERIDQGAAFTGLAASEDGWVVYAVLDGEGGRHARAYRPHDEDCMARGRRQGRPIELGSGTYVYPLVSDRHGTAVFGLVDGQQVCFLATRLGAEGGPASFRPVPGVEGLGKLKLSARGGFSAFLGADGRLVVSKLAP